MKKSAVVFLHGFKGFKDWGCWPLMEDWFVSKGFDFFRMNFSGNGTTPERPLDFVDLEAFGNNNFSKELKDVRVFLDGLEKDKGYNSFHLIGHSRGGGVATYYTTLDDRIKSITSLGSIASFRRGPEDVAAWKEKGVEYIYNGRTKQNMPLYYQLHEDYLENFENKDVLDVVPSIAVPHLVIHTKDDLAVDYINAKMLNKANPNSELHLFEKGGHTYETKHPWTEKTMPVVFVQILETIASFYDKNSIE